MFFIVAKVFAYLFDNDPTTETTLLAMSIEKIKNVSVRHTSSPPAHIYRCDPRGSWLWVVSTTHVAMDRVHVLEESMSRKVSETQAALRGIMNSNPSFETIVTNSESVDGAMMKHA